VSELLLAGSWQVLAMAIKERDNFHGLKLLELDVSHLNSL
jgi:hypothetical protein